MTQRRSPPARARALLPRDGVARALGGQQRRDRGLRLAIGERDDVDRRALALDGERGAEVLQGRRGPAPGGALGEVEVLMQAHRRPRR